MTSGDGNTEYPDSKAEIEARHSALDKEGERVPISILIVLQLPQEVPTMEFVWQRKAAEAAKNSRATVSAWSFVNLNKKLQTCGARSERVGKKTVSPKVGWRPQSQHVPGQLFYNYFQDILDHVENYVQDLEPNGNI